jgi:hypothetical protein
MLRLSRFLSNRTLAQMNDVLKRYELNPSCSSAVSALGSLSRLDLSQADKSLSEKIDNLFFEACNKEDRSPIEVVTLLRTLSHLQLSPSKASTLRFNTTFTWYLDRLPLSELISALTASNIRLLDGYSKVAFIRRLEDWAHDHDPSEAEPVASALYLAGLKDSRIFSEARAFLTVVGNHMHAAAKSEASAIDAALGSEMDLVKKLELVPAAIGAKDTPNRRKFVKALNVELQRWAEGEEAAKEIDGCLALSACAALDLDEAGLAVLGKVNISELSPKGLLDFWKISRNFQENRKLRLAELAVVARVEEFETQDLIDIINYLEDSRRDCEVLEVLKSAAAARKIKTAGNSSSR